MTETKAREQSASSDLHKVGLSMTKLKVSGLPRNYQLFHEALFGQNRNIATEIAALGANPSQAMLDDIGLKYHLVSHCGLVADKSQADAVRMLREVGEQLAEGLRRKQSFMRTVETVKHSVTGDATQSLASFSAEMDFLNASLSNLLLYETELTEKLRGEMEKLETLEKGTAVARAAASTDRITGLPNQVALLSRLTELYDGDEIPSAALILIDIDDFRLFNSKYGPQPANMLLKKLGALFRKTIKKDDFVARMGNDDFGFLFSNVGLDVARTIAARLRSSVEETMVYSTSDKTDPGRVTVSVGIALSSDAPSPARLLANAQAALASAQSNRRQPLQIYARAS